MSVAPEIERLTMVTTEMEVEVALSVIVPVYDQAETIAENVRRFASELRLDCRRARSSR